MSPETEATPKSPKRDAMDRLDGVRKTQWAKKHQRVNILELASRYTDVMRHSMGPANLFVARCPIHTLRNGVPPKNERFCMYIVPKADYFVCTICGIEGNGLQLEAHIAKAIHDLKVKMGAGQL